MKDVVLFKQCYKLFPYEEVLAKREIDKLLVPTAIINKGECLVAKDCLYPSNADKLTFFSAFIIDNTQNKTIQFIREHNEIKRQNTRYYAHGIHEYKGKFNPQIVHTLLNIYGIKEGCHVLDPFCGSGTSLFECQIQNILSIGVDINPMAVFIAKVKTSIYSELESISTFNISHFVDKCKNMVDDFVDVENERTTYLHKWFEDEYYVSIETIKREAFQIKSETLKNLILLTTSNILRDYSCQEPTDLRIRRRHSPYPEETIWNKLEKDFSLIQEKIRKMSIEDLNKMKESQIYNKSIIDFAQEHTYHDYFDFALTSPPYATALPYIDTQRLSIVWLELAQSKDIKELECSLIGTREVPKKKEISLMKQSLFVNANNLSEETYRFCMKLQENLSESDGFRKQNVPVLLYKYFSEMAKMFSAVYSMLKNNATFCLIVGYNKTNINGGTIIDTPYYLTKEAERAGFNLEEILPLETYQRYDIHQNNSITSEALIVLKK